MGKPKFLRSFWRYYGAKWQVTPKYPPPKYDTIIEPFAGSAGYSLHYYDRKVILVERYEVVAGIWRYLIAVRPNEIYRIPEVDAVDDLPSWVPQEARWLVGFWMNEAAASPRRTLSVRAKQVGGWTQRTKERIASQVNLIKHWRVIEGSYNNALQIKATWFVDPPYANRAGSHYVHAAIDYQDVGEFCLTRQGQVIVCENDGATWLPFEPFITFNAMTGRTSSEVIWTKGC